MLLVDVKKRAGHQPRQPLAEAVAPVFPVVAIAGLDVPHIHPGGKQQRDDRSILVDQRLVHAAADEDPLGHRGRLGPEPVHERDHRIEQRAAVVAVADVGEREAARLQQQPAVEAGVPARGRQRRDRAEAGAHQAPALGHGLEREGPLDERHQVLGHVPGVALVVGVLAQAIGRAREHDDRVGDLEPVGEVVEDRAHRRVAQVVVAVVDDQQRVAAAALEPGRHVQAEAAAPERARVEEDLVEPARRRGAIVADPLGHLVAGAVGDRVGPERIAGQGLVERILDPLAVAVADDLELVLDPRPGRQLHRQVPDVGVGDPGQRLRRRQAEDPVLEVHGLGVAAPDERDRRADHDRELVAPEPGVDGLARARPGLELGDHPGAHCGTSSMLSLAAAAHGSGRR